MLGLLENRIYRLEQLKKISMEVIKIESFNKETPLEVLIEYVKRRNIDPIIEVFGTETPLEVLNEYVKRNEQNIENIDLQNCYRLKEYMKTIQD